MRCRNKTQLLTEMCWLLWTTTHMVTERQHGAYKNKRRKTLITIFMWKSTPHRCEQNLFTTYTEHMKEFFYEEDMDDY